MSDHIYLLSPSGAMDHSLLERSIERLKLLGYRVTVDRAAAKRYMRFAGTDTERLGSFARAAKSKANIVMATRGGYGLSRLLDSLDYQELLSHPKKWIGYSDFTAFQLAGLARTRAGGRKGGLYAGPSATFFAGSVADDYHHSELDEVTLGCFQEMMDGSAEAFGWDAKGQRKLSAQGALWGGNLCMVASLIGTPFMPKINGLFFCEDVGEFPYRTERMFAQLLHAGILQRQKAVILGHFSDYKLTPNDAGFDIPIVVSWLREQLKPHGVPVVTGLPFGHVPTKLTLPLGRTVDLIVESGTAFLVFAHQH